MHYHKFSDRKRRSGVSFGRRRFPGASRFNNRGGNRARGSSINIAQLINKAVITEKVEHFVPEHQFSDFQIDQRIKTNISAKGYTSPTPIQDRVIPHVLRGSDVIGIANTGTGKTGAFLIPLIQKIILNPRENVLIVAPTRELAMQIEEEFKGFSRFLSLFSCVCVGGAPMERQMRQLRYRNHVIIGTPGRLKDLMDRRVIVGTHIHSVVLDEADRMLDMGFINDMRWIMGQLPKERQTLFFSATFPTEIQRFTKEFLKEPVSISVKTQETPSSIDQDIIRVGRDGNKFVKLCELLKTPDFGKVLVFGRTKHGVEKLTKMLVEKGFRVASIHGNKNLSKRRMALDMFKKSHVQALIATDVVARGLDINGVSHVINYDIPQTYEDYVHRIGRTGRAGKRGKALTFVE